jgi:hypothetical protein
VLLFLLCGLGGTAWGKSTRDFDYTAEQVWPTLLRYLRVDEKVKITDKDQGAGFVLFELTEKDKTFSGSVEVVKIGEKSTRVILKIADRPSYVEEVMLDHLAVKLKDEAPHD